MHKSLLFSLALIVTLCFAVLSTASAETVAWQGTVTAVNSNGNRPGRSFTAVDASGQVKMFYISSLEHLNVNDRVELHYLSGDKYPLNVTRIRFLEPAQ